MSISLSRFIEPKRPISTTTSQTQFFVQGDRPNEWWPAMEWQQKLYHEHFGLPRKGGQGGALYPLSKTRTITNGKFDYHVRVDNGFREVSLINETTQTARMMRELPAHQGINKKHR
jgi:hypothetical protein